MEKCYVISTKALGKGYPYLRAVAMSVQDAVSYINNLYKDCEFVSSSDLSSEVLVDIRNLIGCIVNEVSNKYLMELTAMKIKATARKVSSMIDEKHLTSPANYIYVLNGNMVITTLHVEELTKVDDCYIV